MRNYWDILWLSLHRRDWINSVRLSSWEKNLATPANLIWRNLGCWYLSSLTCRSCPLYILAAPLLPRCRDNLAPKIILQAEWQLPAVTRSDSYQLLLELLRGTRWEPYTWRALSGDHTKKWCVFRCSLFVGLGSTGGPEQPHLANRNLT